MKKSWLKKAVSISMVFAMTLGLCACGGGNKKENAGLAKENVYKFEAFTMPEIGGDDYNIYTSTYKDGIIYLVLQVYHWSEENSDMDIRLLTMKEDGTDVQLTPLEIPQWKGTIENTGTTAGSEEGNEPAGEPGAQPEDGAEGDTTEPATEEDDTAEPDTEGDGEADLTQRQILTLKEKL